jgi:D-aminopeptidase
VYPNDALTAVFTATVHATEEAIVNAMAAADTSIGASGFRVEEMPEGEVRALFRQAAD